MVYPKITFKNNCDNNEDYFKQQCLLYLPWREDESTLLGERSTWKELYDEKLQDIMKKKGCLGNLHVETSIPNEDDDIDMIENTNAGNLLNPEEWMTISRMGPNQDVDDTDLGLRETDLNYDWHNITKKYDKYGGIEALQSFLETKKKEHEILESTTSFPDVDYSHDQLKVLDLVRRQIQDLKQNSENSSIPKRTIVQGKAGTGKSLVISAMVSLIIEQFGPTSVLLLGPTGVSAININGATYHSKLRINSRQKEFLPLRGIALHEFQMDLKNVKFVIIDEFSMVGCESLHKIDERLRQATGKISEEFGGLNIYLFGDVKQLPPIGDPAPYSTRQESFETLKGKHLYENFQTAVILEKIHRQQDQDFQRVLNNISLGCVTKEDYALLKTRFITYVTPQERMTFRDVIHLYPLNKNVKLFNKEKLENVKCQNSNARAPVARIPAQHNSKLAATSKDKEAEGLEPILYLARNVPIMLRVNLWTAKGLVNGSTGRIIDILYHQDATPGYDSPAVLVCHFDSYKGPYLDDDLKTVPIIPFTKSWSKDGETCTRVQFPVNLAYAATVHKSQGLTLSKAFVDIGDNSCEKPGLIYVALSRAKSLSGLLLQPFPFSRLALVNTSKSIAARRKWEENLKVISL